MTLLFLAVLIVAFAATWLTLPGAPGKKVSPPASLFARGITQRGGYLGFYRRMHSARLHEVKQRIVVVYGGAAAVVILVGLAFGAAHRRD